MLPGGENGGAKLMTLELIRALAELLPQTTLLLLTADSSHSELDSMEQQFPNIKRLCVLHTPISTPTAPPVGDPWRERIVDRIKAIARKVLPFKMKQRIKRWLHRAQPAPGSAKLLRQIQADMLFCPFTAPFYADKSIPTISVIYDLQYRAFPDFFSPEDWCQREEAFKTAYRNADHLVTISNFVKKTVVEASGLSPQQVSTVTIGLFRSHEMYRNEDNVFSILSKYSLIPGEYILYPANFWEHKNHAMLLTSFGMYRQAHPDQRLKLVCTGAPGSSADNFCSTVQRMGLADWVFYPGFVSTDEYECLLNAAFALIFPSLYEGFGIPVLEAMAAGVPVLCSNVTSLPEVGGDAVLYFDPRIPADIAKTLDRVVNEPGLREALITNGFQRARLFQGSKRMANQYIEIFADVLSNYINNRKTSLQGIYKDGWTSDSVKICFPSAQTGVSRSLSIDLENPDWIKNTVKIQTSRGGKSLIKPTVLKPGQKTRLEISLSETGGILEIEISPTFNPTFLGIGKDTRELGLRCCQCEIIIGFEKTNLLEEE